MRVFRPTLFAAVTEKSRPSLQEAEQRKKLRCTKFYFFIMAALHSRCGHYILQLWFLSFFLLVLFFAYSQRSQQSGCLLYFDTRCGLSANLECMSEICCTRLAENTGRNKSPSAHHRRTSSGYIFANKVCNDNRKKNFC